MKVPEVIYIFTVSGVEKLEERQLQVKMCLYSHFTVLELTLKLTQIFYVLQPILHKTQNHRIV